MTREELCALLQLPPETPPADLIQARSRRLAEIDEALREGGLSKPVRLKFQQERGSLEPVHSLIAELEIVSHVEAYVQEITAEFAKPNAVRGVIRLCLGKLKPLIPELKDEATRFRFEKLVVEFEERLTPLTRPPQPAAVPEETKERIEGYFGEIAAETAKSDPGRGVVRLCLGKLKPLVEAIKDESTRYEYEKRIVQIEDRLGLRISKPPMAPPRETPPPPPALPKKPAAVEPTKSLLPPPAPPVSGGAAGTLLELTPVSGAGAPRPPLRFVARPRFLLGRRRAVVDFATLLLPETESNRRKNETISRINTTFFVKNDQIWVQDGELQPDGSTKPSTNGTSIDGHPVAAAKALNLSKEIRVKVGQHNYELLVVQVPAAAPEGPPLVGTGASFSTQPTQVIASRLTGCVRFVPTAGGEMAVAAVWIFTDAAVGSDPQSAVRLSQAGVPPVAARFHHWQGGFWIEVPAGGGAVSLDGRRLAPGDVLPMQDARSLQLGALTFEVRVSS